MRNLKKLICFIIVFASASCSKEWLELLFECCHKCKTAFKQETMDQAIKMVEDNEVLKKYLQENFEKLKQYDN